MDAEQIIKSNLLSVNEQLLYAKSYSQQIRIIDIFLQDKIRLIKTKPHVVDKIGQVLQQNPCRFSLDWLADQACLSPRQFERRFVERMGIGPKLFGRISRFHQAFMYKESHPRLDWFTVAVKFGYTDVQHLSKDVKEFAGVAPNTLLSEYALSAENILPLG